SEPFLKLKHQKHLKSSPEKASKHRYASVKQSFHRFDHNFSGRNVYFLYDIFNIWDKYVFSPFTFSDPYIICTRGEYFFDSPKFFTAYQVDGTSDNFMIVKFILFKISLLIFKDF